MSGPIERTLLLGRLDQIVEEMDARLVHAAFSPAMAIDRDAAHGLHDAETGETLVCARQGFTADVTPFAVRAVIAAATAEGPPRDGDLWICNDPYIAGPHPTDMRLIRPVLHGDAVFCWLASAGRWDEIGGAAPAIGNPRIGAGFEEGLLIPPLRLIEAGRFREEIARVLFANLRHPARARGDLDAHRAALDAGAERLSMLLDTHGAERIREVLSDRRTRAGDRFAAALEAFPDGKASIDDALDNDGVTDVRLPIALDLTSAAGVLTLDFSRSAPACRGPMNLSRAATVAACHAALRKIFGAAADAAGCSDRVRVIISDGALLAAAPPKPVGAHGETALRVAGVVLRALDALAPGRVPASGAGTLSTLALSGNREDGAAWATVSSFAGGAGAGASNDGAVHADPPLSPTRMPPLERLEAQWPVKIRGISLRQDSGGPGRMRGGLGTICEIELLDTEAEACWLADRAVTAPPGAAEGRAGALGTFRYESDIGPASPPLHSKEAAIWLRRGQAVRLETPGGGGYGDPYERDPAAVARDVASGAISADAGRRDYGVALERDGSVDQLATATLRSRSGALPRDEAANQPELENALAEALDLTGTIGIE